MKINFFKKVLSLLTIAIIALSALPAAAQIVPGSGGGDNAAKYADGSYELNDFIILGKNVAAWILGIVGSLALLFFIYGGIMFLIAGGKEEQIKKGKDIITAAIIGLILVFASYLIIAFFMRLMGLSWDGSIALPTQL